MLKCLIKYFFHLRSRRGFILTPGAPSHNEGWHLLLGDQSWTVAWCHPAQGTQTPLPPPPPPNSPLQAGQAWCLPSMALQLSRLHSNFKLTFLSKALGGFSEACSLFFGAFISL